ncbi:transcriptional enhancer factor [Entomortierella parvispora]|uniref:Transcriptional enhancer factor n=1 Tax=Entomortierella parvispora TaxID=205924 RepID=A0A9P3HAQ2_9FUNG|nr:transcriptional enhancer factor [Entomortierella parvispora]
MTAFSSTSKQSTFIQTPLPSFTSNDSAPLASTTTVPSPVQPILAYPASTSSLSPTSSTSSITSLSISRAPLPHSSSASRPPPPIMTNSSKRSKEEVWPDNVEQAFMEALVKIPKLGRRKVVVDTKPCGRNELIAAYIHKQTGRWRTRKQVSSHIQVLKNTRKDDQRLMDLLSDASVDEGDDAAMLLAALGTSSIMYGESSSPQISPVSPTGSVTARFERLDNSSSPEIEDERKPTHHRQLSIASILNPDMETESQQLQQQQPQQQHFHQQFQQLPPSHRHHFRSHSQHYQRPRRNTSSVEMYSYSTRDNIYEEASFEQTAHGAPHPTQLPSMERAGSGKRRPSQEGYDPARSYFSERFSYWPCQFKLTQEERRPPHAENALPREILLSGSDAPFQDNMECVPISALSDSQFPHIKEAFQRKKALHLNYKVGLNLGSSVNTTRVLTRNLFQSTERYTVMCTTRVFSFGNQVVESQETQQAAFYGGRYVYSFKMVNEWFYTFLQTLNDGRSLDEAQASLRNITILQEFDRLSAGPALPEWDSEAECLLVVAYQFNASNQGGMTGYRLTDDAAPLSKVSTFARTRANTWDNSSMAFSRNFGSGGAGPGIRRPIQSPDQSQLFGSPGGSSARYGSPLYHDDPWARHHPPTPYQHQLQNQLQHHPLTETVHRSPVMFQEYTPAPLEPRLRCSKRSSMDMRDGDRRDQYYQAQQDEYERPPQRPMHSVSPLPPSGQYIAHGASSPGLPEPKKFCVYPRKGIRSTFS